MKPRQDYMPKDSGFPYKGLDSVSPETIMHPSLSPSMLDVVVRDGTIASRTGYEKMAGDIAGTTMLVEEFIDAGGSKFLVIATTSREYKYDGDNDAFVEITAGYGAVTAVAHNGGDSIDITGDFSLVYLNGSKITVSDCTNSENNSTFSVTGSAYATGTTTVDVSDTLVTEASPPAGARARQERTGTELNMVDFVQGTDASGTYLFITNGVNFPRYWDGSGVFALADDVALSYTNFAYAKTVDIIDTYLVFAGIKTASEEHRLIAWSDTKDFFDFATGNSGSSLQPEAKGNIWRLAKLSDRLAFYTQGGTVHLMSHIGGDVLFGFDTILEGLVLAGPRAIVNLGAFHLLLSKEGFFVFDGTRLVRPYGKALISRYIKDNLSPDYAVRAFGFNDVPNTHAYIVVPTGEDSSLTILLEYDVGDFRNSVWMPLNYTHRPTAFGFYSRHGDLTWAGLYVANPDLNWQDSAFDAIWRIPSIKSGFPSRILGSGTSIYRCEDTLADDDGTGFDSRWSTIALTVPGSFRSVEGRWLEIEGSFKGDSVDVHYSTDLGSSWTFAKTETGVDADGVSLTPAWVKYRFLIDIVSDTVMIRPSCPDAAKGFAHRWLRAWVLEGEPKRSDD